MDKGLTHNDEAIQSVQRLLESRAEQLRRFVEVRIPVALKGEIQADDLLQEIWVAAFRNAESYSEQGHFDAWLLEIARNRLVDAIRRATADKRGLARQQVFDLNTQITELFHRLVSPKRTPSSQIANRELINAVRVAIASLSGVHRRVIWMKEIEGRSDIEIGQMLNRSPDSIKGILRRGKIKLQSRLRHLDSSG